MSNVEVFRLSATGHESGLALSMGEGFEQSQYQFLNPDVLGRRGLDVRRNMASSWPRLVIDSGREKGRRGKPFFEDAISSGFFLPGCSICVSDNARTLLEPIIGDQALFLPIEIRGAPVKYWVLYVTSYYDALDFEASRLSEPAPSIADRRLQLRAPQFERNADLHSLFLFRVPAAENYVPFGLGDFATSRFLKVCEDLNLSGFTFIRTEPADREEPVRLVTCGPRYSPVWT